MMRAMDGRLARESLSGSWLSARLGVGAHRLDAMRRGGELLGVRRPGGHDYLYPSWQFENGEPLTSVQRIIRAAREAGLDESRVYTILTARRGLHGTGQVYELLHEGREDDVVELVRAG